MPVRFNAFSIKKIILILTLCLIPFSLSANTQPEDPWSSGRIQLSNAEYQYRIFTQRVEVFDISGTMVFSAFPSNPASRALSCGHTEPFGFHAFFQHLDEESGQWLLSMKRQSGPAIQTISTPESLYSPVLTTENGNILVAVSEPFLLGAWDLDSGQPIWEKRFTTPVLTPEATRIQGMEAIRFLRFHQGKYRWFHFFTGGLRSHIPEIFGPDDEEEPSRMPVLPWNDSPDPRTILAFGDSITYGYVDYEPAPQLGYVPRLLMKLNAEYPDLAVINGGNPAETTVKAMNRYEYVLSASHATYLLFHMGINDSIHPEIPVSTSLFNIRTIMQYALNLGMRPILTTIIPRKPSHWSGQSPHREHAEAIRSGILVLASDLSLPCIDFWTIFENYPAADGGYPSLMSDYVHPSPAGYEVMATRFHTRLLALPPSIPTNIEIVAATPYRVMMAWSPNSDFDNSGYQLDYGYSTDQLDRHASVLAPQFTFLRSPFQGSLNRHRYVQVRAVDRYGNISPESAIVEVSFSDPASTASSQKQIPRVKRIPLKSDDSGETLR